MIQPVNALTPRADFRGSARTKMETVFRKSPDSKIALYNAAGAAAAAGGITATISRAYTPTWAHAGVLGVCGAFLTLFFMTPQLIDKFALKPGAKAKADVVVKEDAVKVADVVKEHIKPSRKFIPFR